MIKRKRFSLGIESIVYTAGGAFLGLVLFNSTEGAIIGGLIGFVISLRF